MSEASVSFAAQDGNRRYEVGEVVELGRAGARKLAVEAGLEAEGITRATMTKTGQPDRWNVHVWYEDRAALLGAYALTRAEPGLLAARFGHAPDPQHRTLSLLSLVISARMRATGRAV